MKMSDVFELPIDGELVEPADIYNYMHKGVSIDAADRAAARAINMHDELVDALDCVLNCWLEDCDPTELSPVVHKAISVLTRAKGAE